MQSLRDRLKQIPEGNIALFFIQVFATLGFAVLYSTLVLYATKHLSFTAKDATAMMGVFGAFNYGLHLFGGYLGGRFLSNRNLFVGGMVLQTLGSGSIALGTTAALYVGLALFLTGSGLNVTCLNMMLTQRFKPEDPRREGAFLWNYAGMNIGFFIGFAVAGHFQLQSDYSSLFIFATVGNILAIIICAITWRVLADINTPLLDTTASQFRARFGIGMAILVGVVPVVWMGLQYASGTGWVVKGIGGLVAAGLVYVTLKHPNAREKNNMWAYLILTLGSLVFWSLYQMAPSGLQLFADNNVDLRILGVTVAPQWIQNINTVVIVIGAPLMTWLFARLRARGWDISIPKQFSAAIILMGFGFLALPLGISLANEKGMVGFVWLFISYVLQSVGELLISPIGYAMIGRLAPRQYQGVMMGSWMLVTGVASLLAGDFSGMLPEPSPGAAATTNPAYASLFTQLGVGTLVVGVVLVVLVPFLGRLIKDDDKPNAAGDGQPQTTLAAA